MTHLETNTKIKNSDSQAPPLHSSDQWILIGTGNYYKGKWNHRTMSGKGIYVVPDGTVYKGNFEDGLLHGLGTTYYPSGSRIEGVWKKGKCIERNYIFSDGLRFQPNNWQYCKMPDRRYAVEHIHGLEPAGRSLITNRQPTVRVRDGAYDAGDGFYRPLTNTVHDYWTDEPIRVPTAEDSKWIVENCRRGGDRVVGFRPELHENWYKSRKNVWSDSDTVPSDDRIVLEEKSILADIESVPLSVFDLSLENKRSIRKSTSSDRMSSSSSTSLDQWSSSVSKTAATHWLDGHQKPVAIARADDDDRPSATQAKPESATVDKQKT